MRRREFITFIGGAAAALQKIDRGKNSTNGPKALPAVRRISGDFRTYHARCWHSPLFQSDPLFEEIGRVG